MSALTVRKAVAAWLGPPAVDGLNSVSPYAAVITPANEILGYSGRGDGAGAWIHCNRQSEFQAAVPVGQERMVTHDLVILVYFRSHIADAEKSQVNYDVTKEALLARIRSDPRMGTSQSAPPVIFQAGLGPLDRTGASDLIFESDPPTQVKTGGIEIWGRLSMSVSEQIQFGTVTR